tara:strand:- start:1733 stop:2056 length:324 start_codon:yes stop_codon:yes gene_type:complete
MSVQYADITAFKEDVYTGNRQNYMCVHGYTKRGGCPTDIKVKLRGINRWYRVYSFCVSNTETLFVKMKSKTEKNQYDFLVVRPTALEEKGVKRVEDFTVIEFMEMER